MSLSCVGVHMDVPELCGGSHVYMSISCAFKYVPELGVN